MPEQGRHVFKDKTVLITGGTGSLGKVLTRVLLARTWDRPRKVRIFSRDEAKQHFMRLEYLHKLKATDEVIYSDFSRLVEFRIGDVRDYHSVRAAVDGAHIVINAAALKQVPSCEYFPYEAVLTNVVGAENLVRAVREGAPGMEAVVGVSTDKACKAVNVMGMTKSLQERIFISANLTVPGTRFVCVRYGNVLASRGSVIPLFHEQIRSGGPITVTTKEMTRFLLPLESAVALIIAALAGAQRGETWIPKIPAARIVDVARAMAGEEMKIVFTGIRPGEKVHEILVSEEEAWRTVERSGYYAIQAIQPELRPESLPPPALEGEYSSSRSVLTLDQTRDLLRRHRLMPDDEIHEEGEFLR